MHSTYVNREGSFACLTMKYDKQVRKASSEIVTQVEEIQ